MKRNGRHNWTPERRAFSARMLAGEIMVTTSVPRIRILAHLIREVLSLGADLLDARAELYPGILPEHYSNPASNTASAGAKDHIPRG